jgi:hypothetical protein
LISGPRNGAAFFVLEFPRWIEWMAAFVDRRLSDKYYGNGAQTAEQIHTAPMGLHYLLADFFQRVAVGAAAALTLIVVVGLQIPRRSQIAKVRRSRR